MNINQLDGQRLNYINSKFIYDFHRVYPEDIKLEVCKIQEFPTLISIVCYRFSRELYLSGNESEALRYSLIGRHYGGCEIYYSADIGVGLKINHGLSTVIGSRCTIGVNCTLHQGVTISGHYPNSFISIGDNVVIYPNALVIGNIRVGNNVIVGANSVVKKSIEDNKVVAGAPAKIIREIYI